MDDIRLGVVRGISYGLFGPPEPFLPQARALGAGLVRVYLYWGQVEPEPGRFDWTVVDALLAQFDGDEELWVTVCSSSRWATRRPTDFLPPSPARDLGRYRAFVAALVRRCAGAVRYWQCENEPSNAGLLWDGTADEYAAQLRAFHAAVHAADGAAEVVLGGCGYDVLGTPPDGGEDDGERDAARRFFDRVLSAGRDAFDLFAVNLYGDPAGVPGQLATAERMMRAHGTPRPVLVGEHGGPVLFEFPEVSAELYPVLAAAATDMVTDASAGSTDELRDSARRETAERRAMRALYDRAADLPPRLRMFLADCPPELLARRHRIACRQLVTRTVLALAAGVRRTACWALGPEAPGPVDPYRIMHLMFGSLALLDYRGRTLDRRLPAADAFARLSGALAGARSVTAVPVGTDTVSAFRVERAGRPPLDVLWDRRDAFDGEDAAPLTVPWPAPGGAVSVEDALGAAHAVRVRDGRAALPVSDTPLFVTSAPGPART